MMVSVSFYEFHSKRKVKEHLARPFEQRSTHRQRRAAIMREREEAVSTRIREFNSVPPVKKKKLRPNQSKFKTA